MEIICTRVQERAERESGNQYGESPGLAAGDMEFEVVIFCSQVGLPVERQEHQPTHKTFNPKFVIPTRYSGIKMEKMEGMAN